MANFGRFVCVLVPFLLTLASLIAMLVGGLSGILDKSLYMFSVNLTELSVSPLSVASILDGSGIDVPGLDDINIPGVSSVKRQTQTENITAADLGLYNVYDVNVWNYCYVKQDGKRECADSSFNWAANVLNTTTGEWSSMLTSTGLNVTLPEEITDAVQAFSTVSRWTQVVFIIAYVALGVELFFGLFANYSRVFSCITWLVAVFAALAAGAAAGLATATSAVVVGAVEVSESLYGVDSHMNTRFLATVWLGVAFALGAALFWMFTICCCRPDRSSGSSSRNADAEKYVPAGPGYQRLSDPSGYNSGYAQQYPRQAYGAPQGQYAGAYEPYSHARA